MLIIKCPKCQKAINKNSATCPQCNEIIKKPKGPIWIKVLVVIFSLGILINVISLFSGSKNHSSTSQEVRTESSAEQVIKADIEEIRKGDYSDAVKKDQERFAQGALNALHCLEDSSWECEPSMLESSLKGLPKGWVEKSLGEPSNIQKINGNSYYYWALKIGKNNCKLQLEYSFQCPAGVNGGDGACTFNFYC